MANMICSNFYQQSLITVDFWTFCAKLTSIMQEYFDPYFSNDDFSWSSDNESKQNSSRQLKVRLKSNLTA